MLLYYIEVRKIKREFDTTNAKFVFTKDELGYQEVLDDMCVAEEITIVTYNISEQKEALVNGLRRAGQHCKINIITNIPARWKTYYGDAFREKARNKINLYLFKLNPEKLGIKPKVFFDFSNHGKIIMTNNVAYVGSANYSEVVSYHEIRTLLLLFNLKYYRKLNQLLSLITSMILLRFC